MDDNTLIAWLIGNHINRGEDVQKVMKVFYRANPDEITILADLMRIKLAQEYFGQVMRGAHVEIRDQHARYHTWRKLRSAGTRLSSHKSYGAQYHVDGPFCHTILFGKRRDVTWLQLERHAFGGAKNGFLHIVDWIRYHVTDKNQGPYGDSVYVESNPLRFDPPRQPRVIAVPPTIIR